MIRIPNEGKQLFQTNNSDIFGSLWSTFNIDLTNNPGRTQVSPRLLINTKSADVTTLGVPVGFKYFDGRIWTVAGTRVFSNSGVVNGNFTEDASGSAQTDYTSDESDIELFNGKLYVTSTDALVSKSTAAGAWSVNGTALSTGTAHMMTTYGDRLYVTNLTSKIYSINTSDTMATSGAYTLSFTNSSSNVISFLRSSSNRIWIGTINQNGGKGAVHEWDGSATQVSKTYRLRASGALACVIKDDIPYIMDTNGVLSKWNGATFQEVARLPIKKKFLLLATDTDNVDRFIHPNGMTVVEDKILILVRNTIGDDGRTINENFPSGVWEYSEENGLYHKYSLSYHTILSGSVTDYGQNRLSQVGAISDMKLENDASNANGILLVGAQYYTDATSTAQAIWIDDTVDTTQKYGYFVTTKIVSANLQDSWNKIYARFKELLSATDKVIVKYRTEEEDPTEVTITWTNDTNIFTTSGDISGYAVGDEVEVTQGQGSGKCAHITKITLIGSAYEVELDENFTGATISSTAKARFQHWKKCGVETLQDVSFHEYIIGAESVWIQFKVCMQFTGKNELYDLLLVNKVHKPIV